MRVDDLGDVDQKLLVAVLVEVRFDDVDTQALEVGRPGHPMAERHRRLLVQAVAVAMAGQEVLAQGALEVVAKRRVEGDEQLRPEGLPLGLETNLDPLCRWRGYLSSGVLQPPRIHPFHATRWRGFGRLAESGVSRIQSAGVGPGLHPAILTLENDRAIGDRRLV